MGSGTQRFKIGDFAGEAISFRLPVFVGAKGKSHFGTTGEGGPRGKSLDSRIRLFLASNPLKRLKTDKKSFGKAWKKLGAGRSAEPQLLSEADPLQLAGCALRDLL